MNDTHASSVEGQDQQSTQSSVGLDFHTRIQDGPNPPYPLEPAPFFLIQQYVGKVVYLDPRRVKPMKGQPREEFEGIDDLAETLRVDGQQTAIVVHPIQDPDYDVELQAGERRTHASIRAGIMVRAEIRAVPQTSKRHYANAVVENFNRRDLTLLETVKMVARLMADGHTEKDIVRMTGKTTTWVSQYTALSTMDFQALKLIGSESQDQHSADGRKLRRTTVLPISVAIQIAKLPVDQQLGATRDIIQQNLAIDAARDYVHQKLREGGKLNVRQRSPSELFGVLSRETAKTRRLFERYLDMPSKQLASTLQVQSQEARAALASQMRELITGLGVLLEEVEVASGNNRHCNTHSVADTSLKGWSPMIVKWLEGALRNPVVSEED